MHGAAQIDGFVIANSMTSFETTRNVGAVRIKLYRGRIVHIPYIPRMLKNFAVLARHRRQSSCLVTVMASH